MTLGFLLMSGGHSSRMGTPKALLDIGGETLLSRIARAGAAFPERILSVNDPSIPTPEGFARVEDVYTDCGPMGGLHAALKAASCDALVVAPCDSPLYSAEAAAFLAAQMEEGLDAVLPEDADGRVHPLMGVYAKSCLPALCAHLDAGKFKLMRMLDTLNVRRVRMPEAIGERIFENLNTPEDYRALRLDALRPGLEAIAREAGRIILSFGSYDVEQKEGHANFVTSVDKAVEDYLFDALPRLVPGSAFIGEEQENDALTDAPTWVIDPVDGTTNLIHDCRWSAVSIALLENKTPVIGLVYQPWSGELFWARIGGGAQLNGQPIRTSQHPFPTALVAFGTSPYHANLAEASLRAALAFLQRCADIRRGGSAALDLAYVACGRLDVYFELTLKPWDFAAGALLVTEAGGRFINPLGDQVVRFGSSQGVLAANTGCAQEALAMLEEALSQ